MSSFYREKVVFVTGASSGIGKDIAILLAKKGAHLILSALSKEELEEVKEVCIPNAASCHILPADFSKPKEVQQIAEKAKGLHRRIDVLILNAGVSQRSFIHETAFETHQKIFQINYFSNVQIINSLLPLMLEKSSGYIAVTSSIVGKFGFPLRSAYSASKHALQGFFETLRLEYWKHNIHVSIIIPGRVNTNISVNAISGDGKNHGKMDEGQAGGMPSELCAKKYLKAIEKQKRETFVGGKEILMVHIKRLLPSLFNKLAKKIKPT